jgi:hypothetical protein
MIQKTVIKRKAIRERMPSRVLSVPPSALVIPVPDRQTTSVERPIARELEESRQK